MKLKNRKQIEYFKQPILNSKTLTQASHQSRVKDAEFYLQCLGNKLRKIKEETTNLSENKAITKEQSKQRKSTLFCIWEQIYSLKLGIYHYIA